PDVELRPVRQREHADALAGADAAVQQRPELRALILRIPLTLGIAQREDPLLRPRPFFVATGAAERGVEVAGFEAVEQRLRLQQPAAALRADEKRLRAVGDRFLIGVNDEAGADLARVPVAKLDHLAELVRRVDVK